MSRIGSLMSVGKQSLQKSQTALQTTSHNVANVNTEGYTRQRVEQQTAEPVSSGNLRLGQGAKTAAVTRVVNGFLNKQIQDVTSRYGSAAGKQAPLARAEQIFNERMHKELNHFLSELF